MPTKTWKIGAQADNAFSRSDGTVFIGEDGVLPCGGATATFLDVLGLRWTAVDIPKSATITAASLKLYTGGGTFEAGYPQSNIYGVAADNPAAWASSNTPGLAPRTTAYTYCSHQTWTGSHGTPYDTPDIASVVQEIVSRSGWASGNALACVLRGIYTAGSNYSFGISAYQGGPGWAAELTVTWNEGAPATTVAIDQGGSASVEVAGTLQLSATVTNGSGSTTWASSNTSVATVNSSGLVTAVAQGSANITATNNGVTSSPLALTVTAAPTPDPTITITTPSGISTPAGGKIVLEAVVGSGTDPLVVSWHRGGTQIGTGLSFTYDTTGRSNGTETITGRVTDANSKTAEATITVVIGAATATTTRRGGFKVMAELNLRTPKAFPIRVLDSSGNGVNGLSGVTNFRWMKGGAAPANAAGTLTSRTSQLAGLYSYTPSVAECDTEGPVLLYYSSGSNYGETYGVIRAEPATVTSTVTSATSRTALVVPSGLAIAPGWMCFALDGAASNSSAIVESYSGTALVLASPGLRAQPGANSNLLFAPAPAVDSTGGATQSQVQTIVTNAITPVAKTSEIPTTTINAIKAKTDGLPATPAAKDDIPTATIDAIKAKTDALPAVPAAKGDVPTVQQIGAHLDASSNLRNADVPTSSVSGGGEGVWSTAQRDKVLTDADAAKAAAQGVDTKLSAGLLSALEAASIFGGGTGSWSRLGNVITLKRAGGVTVGTLTLTTASDGAVTGVTFSAAA